MFLCFVLRVELFIVCVCLGLILCFALAMCVVLFGVCVCLFLLFCFSFLLFCCLGGVMFCLLFVCVVLRLCFFVGGRGGTIVKHGLIRFMCVVLLFGLFIVRYCLCVVLLFCLFLCLLLFCLVCAFCVCFVVVFWDCYVVVLRGVCFALYYVVL